MANKGSLLSTMNDSTISSASAIITGALTTAAAFGFGIDSNAAAFIAANSPIMNHLFYRSIHFLFGKEPSKLECARLGIAYSEAALTIKKNQEQKRPVRSDDFFDDSYNGNYSKANELVEAALRYTTEDPETIKSICYGRFIGNIPFCSQKHNDLIAINKTIRELTYSELCVINVLRYKGRCTFFALENAVRNSTSTDAMSFYSIILHLKTMGILVPTGQFFSASLIGYVFMSQSGTDIYDLMELDRLCPKDTQQYESLFNQYGKIES